MKRGTGEGGFSLTELLVVMIIFSFVIAGVSRMFVSILGDFKQQSRLAVTNIEGILGLEMMRHDLEHAGYGLAWDGFTSLAYTEVNTVTDKGFPLNDAPPTAPRALTSGNNTGWHGTDRVAIRAVNVALNSASDRWTYLLRNAVTNTEDVHVWTSTSGTVNDNPQDQDRIIVISPATSRTLVPATGGGFSTKFSNWNGGFDKNRSTDSIIYAVGTGTIKMPYNRADYYVTDAGPSPLPGRCAPGTGVLYKAVVNQAGADWQNIMPLLDCVADMQIIYRNDVNGDGSVIQDFDDISGLTAELVRTQAKEVRVYILAQEGQYDRNLTYPAPKPPHSIRVGEALGGVTTLGRDFDFEGVTNTITDWQRYRWKIYTIIVKPTNIAR